MVDHIHLINGLDDTPENPICPDGNVPSLVKIAQELAAKLSIAPFIIAIAAWQLWVQNHLHVAGVKASWKLARDDNHSDNPPDLDFEGGTIRETCEF